MTMSACEKPLSKADGEVVVKDTYVGDVLVKEAVGALLVVGDEVLVA